MKAPILVVDDNADMRSLMKMFLRSEGYEVVTANDGASAMSWLKGGLRPGLIFLDMVMRGIDGTTFLSSFETEMPEVFASTPIVATSGLEASRGLKISQYLRKPVELSVFKQTIERHYVGTSNSSIAPHEATL
ncbi:MAG: response regulator [Bdellovibrionota bacterium]